MSKCKHKREWKKTFCETLLWMIILKWMNSIQVLKAWIGFTGSMCDPVTGVL